MGQDESARDAGMADTASCPVLSPLTVRLPGLLSLAAVPAAILMNPFFFSLAGGLLASISLLLSAPRHRGLGIAGLIGAVVGGSLGAWLLR